MNSFKPTLVWDYELIAKVLGLVHLRDPLVQTQAYSTKPTSWITLVALRGSTSRGIFFH